MLDESLTFIQRGIWWMWFFPGIMIVLTLLCVNFVGDGLRDALDPRGLIET
jgi:peptide/nickel transport system permease protein